MLLLSQCVPILLLAADAIGLFGQSWIYAYQLFPDAEGILELVWAYREVLVLAVMVIGCYAAVVQVAFDRSIKITPKMLLAMGFVFLGPFVVFPYALARLVGERKQMPRPAA